MLGKRSDQRGLFDADQLFLELWWDQTVSTASWPPCGVDCAAMKNSPTSIVRTTAAPASRPA